MKAEGMQAIVGINYFFTEELYRGTYILLGPSGKTEEWWFYTEGKPAEDLDAAIRLCKILGFDFSVSSTVHYFAEDGYSGPPPDGKEVEQDVLDVRFVLARHEVVAGWR